MCDIKLCRICLNKDVKLFKLDQFSLRYYYEQIMNSKLTKRDDLPNWFCVECAALLHKYHKFKEKCSYGQNTLKNLLNKGYMTYEVIEDIRKNRDDLSTIDYFIPNKLSKTYHVKHKPESMISQIENVTVNEFSEDSLKYEYLPEDDDMTLDKLRVVNLAVKLKSENTHEPCEFDYQDDGFDSEALDNAIKNENIETNSKTNVANVAVAIADVANVIEESQINGKKNDEKHLIEDSNSLLFSLLNTKPKRSKKKIEDTDTEKPRKFERKKKNRINDENWEIKILTEDEALEQFNQRVNNSKYIKFNYKCDKCLKGFSRNDILLRHNKQCHDKGSFECRFCHMLFKRKFQLGRHMVVHYYVYQCLRCDLKCNLLSTAAFHEDSHNGVTRTCKLCGEQFKHVSTYYTHLRMSHRNSNVCKLCGASFVSEIGLEFHMKRQHCISEETTEQSGANIYCAKCDVSFVSQSAYDEHLTQSKLHEDEQPLRRKRSRKEIIENATTCRFCKEKFTTRAECRKHVGELHRGVRVGERVMCEICGAWLAASSIEVHMNRHTKKVVFPCQYCGKEFLCKSGYNTHQAKHTGIRPHSCKICHKRFSQKFSMDIHYRRVHLKEPYPKRNRKKNTDEVPLIEKIKWT